MSTLGQIRLVIVFAALLWRPAYAQFDFFQITALQDGGDCCVFPFIGSERGISEERINIYLQLMELDQLLLTPEGNPFKEIQYEEDGQLTGIDHWSFQMLRNDRRVLSLSVDKAWIGLRYNWDRVYYNFDSQTGEYVTMSALFAEDKAGVETVLEKHYLLRLDELYQDSTLTKSDRENLAKVADTDWQNMVGFSILPEGLLVDLFSQLYHWDQAIFGDEISFLVPWAALQPYLSSYGLWLLSDDRDPFERPNFPHRHQVMQGTIGQYPIVFILYNTPNALYESFMAKYAYSKYGKAISLYGNMTSAGDLQLDEECEELDCPVFSLNWKDSGEIEGQWYSSDGQRTLLVQLDRL